MIFTSRSARTENGSRWDLMDAAGGRRAWKLDGALTAMATGGERTPAGTGSATSRGDGPPTTMAAGIGAWILAGFGCRIPNGHQPGFPGGKAPDTSAGLRCLLQRSLAHVAVWRFRRGRLRLA